MIVLDLVCQHEHRFEGWFASAEAFSEQQERGMLTCPVCNNAQVSRLPCVPRIVSSSSAKDEREHESVAIVQEQLRDAIQAYVRDSENVGERFPDEARKMHYKEIPPRNIRGVATLEETRDLLDEGISVMPLMLPPSEETH